MDLTMIYRQLDKYDEIKIKFKHITKIHAEPDLHVYCSFLNTLMKISYSIL